jgi:hypothetical protein
MEVLLPYALTTLSRVKDRLFDPSQTINVNGTTTSGSPTVTSTVPQVGKVVRNGQPITGPGIPANTTVLSTTTTTLTLSQNATASASGVDLTVIDQPVAYDTVLTRMINNVTEFISGQCNGKRFVQGTYTNETYSPSGAGQQYLMLRQTPVFSMSSFQYRAGTPTNPAWTNFIGDQYELVDPITDPISGLVYYPKSIVRVYGVMPHIYENSIRATYVAGWPVDWPNAGNGTTHLLPSDLTDLCENLVVRRFKRRHLAGQSSQALEGATHSWRNDLDADDLDTIGKYQDTFW